MVDFKNILFPSDFSDFSRYAASFAVSFASDYGAKLHVVHVAEVSPDLSEMLSEKIPGGELNKKVEELAVQELEEASTPEILKKIVYEITCLRGKPFAEIVKYANEKEMDMIVMGTHGRSALEAAIMGSTAEKVVRKATCPVLTVRMPGHRFVMPTIG
jgi:nucleotide-binding universal stress UspA family protein